MDSTAEKFIIESFLDYKKRRREGTLYNEFDNTPQKLILFYYLNNSEVDFDHIVLNFKDKFVFNENELEFVKHIEEREGMGVLYDYIRDKEYENFGNIHIILKLHTLLYSKVPYPLYGGKFRINDACISDSDLKTTPASLISREVASLNDDYVELLKFAEMINEEKRSDQLIEYINRCVDLKCRLIEIHPFPDGNGRTCRALVNMLFRKVDLPIVYVQQSERDEYIKAMDKAIREDDKSAIRKFYYYKICDSILELDMNERVKQINAGAEPNESAKKLSLIPQNSQ